MTEFVTIADGVLAQKGSFVATVIKVSELKKGKGKNGDYMMQKFTLKDNTAEIQLTAWNEETNFLKLGGEYEITPWWQGDYEGTPQIGLGKYGKVKLLGVKIQEAIEEPNRLSVPKGKIPDLESPIEATIGANTLLMLQIEKKVRAVVRDLTGTTNDGQVGMYTRMNFYFLKGMVPKD